MIVYTCIYTKKDWLFRGGSRIFREGGSFSRLSAGVHNHALLGESGGMPPENFGKIALSETHFGRFLGINTA